MSEHRECGALHPDTGVACDQVEPHPYHLGGHAGQRTHWPNTAYAPPGKWQPRLLELVRRVSADG